MSEPTSSVVPAAEADLVEQSVELVDDDEDTEPVGELPWESDPADVLEQSRAIGFDDDHDGPGE